MQRTIKGLAAIMLIVCALCLLMTGCSKSISAEDSVSVTFSGVNGYGEAHISGEYDWVDQMLSDSANDFEKLSARMQLQDAVQYTLSKTDGLSNGDKVELKIEADNEKLKQYGYKVKEKTVTFTVGGLAEPVEYDPFEHVTLNVTGTAPYGELEISISSDMIGGVNVNADKTEGLKNGDVITITLSASNDEDVQIYCAKQGYTLTRTSMEFTVSGVNSYVQTLEQIPEEWLKKMQSQTEDVITTAFEKDRPKDNGNATYTNVKTLISKEYAGCYLFTLKEGFNVNNSTPANRIYLLYKLTATSTDGEFSYYYATVFENATLVQGTDFSVDMTEYGVTRNAFVKGYYTYTYHGSWISNVQNYDQEYIGYPDMDTFKQLDILPQVEKYNYVTTMEEATADTISEG